MLGLPDQGLSFLLPMNKGRAGQLPQTYYLSGIRRILQFFSRHPHSPLLLPFGYRPNAGVTQIKGSFLLPMNKRWAGQLPQSYYLSGITQILQFFSRQPHSPLSLPFGNRSSSGVTRSEALLSTANE